jgi:hypothetical protein
LDRKWAIAKGRLMRPGGALGVLIIDGMAVISEGALLRYLKIIDERKVVACEASGTEPSDCHHTRRRIR